VEAFSHFPDKRLVVVGEGPEKIRGGKNVEMLGFVPEARLQELRKKAKGFVFAAEEDFGIAVVEAQGAGTPVIALGRGGSLETVVEGKTGIFFQEPSVASLCDAVLAFEKKDFDPQAIAHHAKQFGKERFIQEWKRWVTDKYEIHSLSRR
jgi:glycosyltransferase involved in cell wall biosynthesis